MAELIQLRKKSQLTLPQSVREKVGLEEGDFLDIHIRDGEIVLKVKKLIDKKQEWFWSERWQLGEKEAEEDIKVKRVHSFPDAASAIDFLHSKTRRKPGTAKKSKL
jgi:AbrB family looped-hinge helix DNA binding protein